MALNIAVVYLLISIFRTSASIKTLFLEEECNSGSLEITLTTTGQGASTNLASLRTTQSVHQTCDINIKTEPGYGLVISFRNIDLEEDPTRCRNFLQVCDDNNSTTVCIGKRLCKMKDRFSLFFNEDARIRYVSLGTSIGSFFFTITSYRKAQHLECAHGFLCDNQICIWKGFHCDTINNCGDESDEKHCKNDWHVTMRIILAIFCGIIFILLFLICFVCCYQRNRRRKNGVTYQYIVT